ncbi:NAD(P)-binding domain-containing protein [Hungatella hathewayi]|uniref:NAD(P)-binding domain-containing protein n=1 Tax=Hungatella hathewayi TaxID=154046 RepID=UPI0031EB9FA5
MKKAGFIGIGIMGKPMALNLLNAGVSLAVYDVNESAVNAVTAAGAESVQPKDMGGPVISFLPYYLMEILWRTYCSGSRGWLQGLKREVWWLI